MAGHEHQTQLVIAQVIIGIDELRGTGGLLFALDLEAQRILLAPLQLIVAQAVDGAVLGGGHQPRGRVVGNAVARPMLQCGDQRILRQFFGQTDVAELACQRTDDA